MLYMTYKDIKLDYRQILQVLDVAHRDDAMVMIYTENTDAITLAELIDAPILIVHMSGAESIEQIRWTRGKGLNVNALTCPQYLFSNQDDLGSDDSFHGARCVCSLPPRDKANQQVIWDALADGLFTVFFSDYAPFNYGNSAGKHVGGKKAPFAYIPNGSPPHEDTLVAFVF
jgi:dihydropyrimidinase